MPFVSGSGRIVKFPKLPKEKRGEGQFAGPRNKIPTFASLPETQEAGRRLVTTTRVSRIFENIISKELPVGFTQGSKIPTPTVPKDLGSVKDQVVLGQSTPKKTGFKGFVTGILGGETSPTIKITTRKELTPAKIRGVVRHEVAHQILDIQKTPQSIQHSIIGLGKAGSPKIEGTNLSLIPATTRFFRSTATRSQRASQFFGDVKRILAKKKK